MKDANAIRHIVVVRLSALGDIVLTVPLIHNLTRLFPEAKITWVISKEFYPLVEGLANVEFVVISKPKKISDYLNIRKQFAGQECDVLLALQANMRVNLIYKMIKAKRKIGFDTHRARDGQRWFIQEQIPYKPEHLMEGFLGFLKPLTIDKPVIDWRLPISTADYQWAHAQLPSDKVLVLHPMASKVERNWSIESYAQLIHFAHHDLNYAIIVTGGPSLLEQNLAQAIIEKCNVPVLNLVGKSTLKQLAALLGSVNVVVCPDTGPAHMASAMGTPVIGLYAVARPELTGPYFSKDLTVNKYPQAVKQFLQKEIEEVDWHTRVHHPQAMSLISVDDVVEKLYRL